jgi:RNA polymerase sigma-70 factor, ECF subfamily
MRAAGTAAAPGRITSLLAEFSRGNRGVESELAAGVYAELHRLAAAYMRRERKNHTLQPTALVNEAWERIAGQPIPAWENRAHFFAIASRCMREILVDHARRRKSQKRGGDWRRITLYDQTLEEQREVVDVLAINEALEHLKALDARACRIVELHFFGGLTFEEMGLVLGMSSRSVKRDWSMARSWLHKELAQSE